MVNISLFMVAYSGLLYLPSVNALELQHQGAIASIIFCDELTTVGWVEFSVTSCLNESGSYINVKSAHV